MKKYILFAVVSFFFLLFPRFSFASFTAAQYHASTTQVWNGANSPTSFTDLDLSSYVGAEQVTVVLKVFNDNNSNGSIACRRNGDTSDFSMNGALNYSVGTLPVSQNRYIYILCPTDTAGVIEWRTAGQANYDIFLEAWIDNNTISLTTSDITEGTNLYYTDARARASISETITGIDYSSSTGIFSITSGYVIPLTASTTNWNTAYGWGNHAAQNYFDIDTDDSDDITEGSTNEFYTDGKVAAYIAGQPGIPNVSNATTGQAIMWDGSGWVAADFPNGTSTSGTSTAMTQEEFDALLASSTLYSMYTGPDLQEWLFVACVIIFFLSLMAWRYIFRPVKEMDDN